MKRHSSSLVFFLAFLMTLTFFNLGKTYGNSQPGDTSIEEFKVSGTVSDAETQEPLIGVTVQVKGSTTGTLKTRFLLYYLRQILYGNIFPGPHVDYFLTLIPLH